MSQPAVTITELDGALGVLPASAGKLLALIGTSATGTKNVPATFARPKDVIANYTSGPLVEAACHELAVYGRPVIVVRTEQTTAGTPGTPVVTGVSGTSVITVTGTPDDDYEITFKVITGGTRGTPGITFVYSLDGGGTWSPVIALGSATTYLIPGSGVTLNFGVGTLIAGDTATSRTTAPMWNTSDLGAALDALGASAASWGLAEIVGPIDSAAFDLLETKFAGFHNAGKERAWIGNTRVPNVGESEATYLGALNTIFASKSTVRGQLCAGSCKLISSVSGRSYKRPISFAVAAVEASQSEEINAADINLGSLVGVSIRDANGNPDEHDESLNPGLDDARFTVLRTWEGEQGVYINRPRLFSPSGSDFQLLAHRRVIDLGHEALRAYFRRRLNRPILVSAATGYILEEEALEIEAGAREVLRATLRAAPKASAVSFVLSRTDNLLSTKTLTGDARIVPLAYSEFANLSIGFINPALQVVAV